MNLNKIVWLDFDYMNRHYEGEAIPSGITENSSFPAFDIYFDNEYNGTICRSNNSWISEIETGMVNIIGRFLLSGYSC